ncbi:MAG: hypothetical protein PUP93_18850 [Rhizonema sp. NSF051]|nr:hypothetical protein [Rhizonema sp. NSF051]
MTISKELRLYLVVKLPATKRQFPGQLPQPSLLCIFSIFVATTLVKSFSGKGLVPDAIANAPDFPPRCSTCYRNNSDSTLTGFPISTTHGLTGALGCIRYLWSNAACNN